MTVCAVTASVYIRHGEVCFYTPYRYGNSTDKLSAAFAIVPVPILIFVALITLIFGTDHPNGKWADRHKMNTSLATAGVDGATPRMSDDMEAHRVGEKPEAEKTEDAVNVDVKEAMTDGTQATRSLKFFTHVWA